jgi:GGDEF domain-containing protein
VAVDASSSLAETVGAESRAVLELRPGRTAWIGLLVVLAMVVVRRATHEGGETVTRAFDLVGHCGIMWAAAVLCAIRALRVELERPAWACMAAALAANAMGETLSYALAANGVAGVGAPDVFWLAYYPFVVAGLALLARERIGAIDVPRVGDGLQAAFIVASLGLILVFFPILDRATTGRHAADVIDIVYPICDLVVVGIVLGVYALSGFRPGRSWVVLGAGLILFVVVDTLYAVEALSNSTSTGLLDGGWPAAALLIAYAAWLPEPRVRAVRPDDWRTVILPEAVCSIAIASQVADFEGWLGDTPKPALLLLVAAQLVFFVQLAGAPLTARANKREDPYSGLWNRLALARDLERVRRAGGPPSILVLCELRGLEELVRREGREARDRVLDAAARALEERFGRWASAYRGEGGDFWVLAPRRHGLEPETLAAEAVGTLAAGYPVVSASVLVPDELADGTDAEALAESRLAGSS